MLHTITHGIANAKPPLLIAHGLFGSGRNWGVIAKRLSDERQVIAVDMRNHGSSLHSDDHSYTALADDLAEVIAAHGGQADVLGHSMGGKAAMVLALEHAEMVNRLTVADIAPVSYSHSQQQYINAMRTLDLSQIEGRAEAQAALLPLVEDPTLASFFTQSLDLKARQWRLNLAALEANMPQILSFPAIDACFTGPSLFLTGATSHYVTRDHRPQIKALFSEARFAKIPEAGHWLHAERPSRL
jgi:pimeloyl-ACP methyl ester carboxylesterase